MKNRIVNGKELSQISLGTVQFGMNYGIANEGGQPSTEKSFGMLDCALKLGITSLDTARAYGTAEDVLGEYFKANPQEKMPFITSKLVVKDPITVSDKEIEKGMYESVETSLKKLGVDSLDCLLLHRGGGYLLGDCKKVVAKTFEKLVNEGYTKMAGVSIYEPEEVDAMLQNDVYRAVQLPMSLFDQQWIEKGYIRKLKEADALVFVRSVFLQGLFFLNPDEITDPLLLEYAKPYILKLHEFCKKSGMTIAEFAISFIRDIDGVTSLVLGADTEAQVAQNINYINAPVIPDDIRKEAFEAFKDVNLSKIMEVLRRPK